MAATLADIQRKYGDSVYPLYKDQIHEPYGEVKKQYYGYTGVVLYDPEEDKILSNLNGKWYKKISPAHCKQYGLKTITEYKEKFGLMKSTALVNKETSKKFSVSAISHANGLRMVAGHKKWKEKVGKQMVKKYASRAGSLNGQKTIQYRNYKNHCPDQLIHRLNVVANQVGGSPTLSDLKKYDPNLIHALFHYYGSFKNAKKAMGMEQTKLSKYEPDKMIAELRTWVMRNGRIPYNLKKLIDGDTFSFSRSPVYTHFGSINKFKMMAGLYQLLEEVKSA